MYREQRVKLKHYSTDDLTAAVWKTHRWFGYNYVLPVVTVGAHPVLSQELLDGHSKKSCRCSCWHSMSVFIVYSTTCCSCLVLFDLLYSQVLKIPLAMFVYGQWLPGNMWHHIVRHTISMGYLTANTAAALERLVLYASLAKICILPNNEEPCLQKPYE